METVELRITIDKEAVEAIFTLLKALTERESTKEKDIANMFNSNTNNTNSFTNVTTTTEKDINNNINTVVVSSLDSESYKQGNSVDYNHGNTTMDTNDEPTLDSITAYIAQCRYKFSPNKFYDYYNGNGWKTKSGISMKERWREFADMWARMEKNPQKPVTANNTGMGTQEERRAAHPFVPTQFTEDGKLA